MERRQGCVARAPSSAAFDLFSEKREWSRSNLSGQQPDARTREVRKPSQMCREGFLFGPRFVPEAPPSLGGFDFIFGCLLLVYYTVCYVPPPRISRNVMILTYLLLTTTWIWT